ncbi:beta-glucosidase [Modestobacter sp. L9-4]|uniref:GH1 family beta-glucosidase n=1 Tax=Modestobacter sp. L9-4 TaxID=2851567 RepID=UPI001C79A0F3|nr:GH1 family beta-glucosidase [Modestobacter sp. L9-4]QXG75566.1 beta-glucosidase [Modestobacter sp. L9-4]
MSEPLTFPAGFRWGTATASYQIEGAVGEGGRGVSIWDTFAATPGTITDGSSGAVADDHYHRYAEDVGLMAELGTGTYRFSFAWPRLQPTGSGALNPEGVAFYDRLLDELHGRGIAPWATLYHWDLPQTLEDAGGWPARDTAARFADYAVAVHARFADRVPDWTTHNEPWCSAFRGYAGGQHAPGRREPGAAVHAAHHLMLGHGMAVQAMRAARPDLRYGITLNLYPTDPATDSAADADAARRVDGICNRLFLDPLLRGAYPADVLDDVAPAAGRDFVQAGDEELIAQPLDVLGVNYYSRHVVRARTGPDDEGRGDTGWVGAEQVVKVGTGRPRTHMGWEIDPDGLVDVLGYVSTRYDAPPLYVTENGAAFDDVVSEDGAVHDPERTAYLDGHFRAALRAIACGVDLRGYFVWSLLDNFEWAFGYTRRFGLVHVDYDTQRRTVKDSGRGYARVTAANAVPADR